MFILDAWHVVAWGSEVTRIPTSRVVCSIPVVNSQASGIG